MTAVSDNTATNLVIDRVGGVGAVNRRLAALGRPVHRPVRAVTTTIAGRGRSPGPTRGECRISNASLARCDELL